MTPPPWPPCLWSNPDRRTACKVRRLGLENAKRGNVTVVAEAEKNIRLQPLAPALHAKIAQRTAALLALLAFGLPAMLTAVLVWLSLGRPLLFRQVRSGLGGASFTLVKFRTMHDLRDADGRLLPDAERETAMTRFYPRGALRRDPAIVGDLHRRHELRRAASTATIYGSSLRCAGNCALPGTAWPHRLGSGQRQYAPFRRREIGARYLGTSTIDRLRWTCGSCC